MGLKLNTASSGSVTLEPANTASNYTLTVPAQTGTVVATDSSGNVGIGTSSPATKLEVRDTSATVIKVAYTGNTGTELSSQASGESRLSTNSSNGYLTFWTGTTASERMRIDSSGNLLVGATSTTAPSIYISPDSGGGALYKNTNSSNARTAAYFQINGTTVGTISTSGSSTTYATSSDYRLKENVAPMTGALAKVSALKPCTYTWKADGSNGEGFIAHELAEVVPDCVTGEKDAVDAEGNPVYQGIDTSFLVATLTAAIQELKAQLDESNLILTSVKTELDTVKTELATLKGQA